MRQLQLSDRESAVPREEGHILSTCLASSKSAFLNFKHKTDTAITSSSIVLSLVTSLSRYSMTASAAATTLSAYLFLVNVGKLNRWDYLNLSLLIALSSGASIGMKYSLESATNANFNLPALIYAACIWPLFLKSVQFEYKRHHEAGDFRKLNALIPVLFQVIYNMIVATTTAITFLIALLGIISNKEEVLDQINTLLNQSTLLMCFAIIIPVLGFCQTCCFNCSDALDSMLGDEYGSIGCGGMIASLLVNVQALFTLLTPFIHAVIVSNFINQHVFPNFPGKIIASIIGLASLVRQKIPKLDTLQFQYFLEFFGMAAMERDSTIQTMQDGLSYNLCSLIPMLLLWLVKKPLTFLQKKLHLPSLKCFDESSGVTQTQRSIYWLYFKLSFYMASSLLQQLGTASNNFTLASFLLGKPNPDGNVSFSASIAGISLLSTLYISMPRDHEKLHAFRKLGKCANIFGLLIETSYPILAVGTAAFIAADLQKNKLSNNSLVFTGFLLGLCCLLSGMKYHMQHRMEKAWESIISGPGYDGTLSGWTANDKKRMWGCIDHCSFFRKSSTENHSGIELRITNPLSLDTNRRRVNSI